MTMKNVNVLAKGYAMEIIVVSNDNNYVVANKTMPSDLSFRNNVKKYALADGYEILTEEDIQLLPQWKQDVINELVNKVEADIIFENERRHHLEALIKVIIAEKGKKYYESWERYINNAFRYALKNKNSYIMNKKDITIVDEYVLPYTILL